MNNKPINDSYIEINHDAEKDLCRYLRHHLGAMTGHAKFDGTLKFAKKRKPRLVVKNKRGALKRGIIC